MELIMDRFGGIIVIIISVFLIGTTAGWISCSVALDKRIKTLEGCCEEVQQYMESTGKLDEEKVQAYVDQRLEEMITQQADTVSQQVKTELKTVREEIDAEISTRVSEEVKSAVESSKSSTAKTTSKKKKSVSGSSQASVSAQSQTSTSVTTITTAETTSETTSYDPDDKHFKVGSGEDEEED